MIDLDDMRRAVQRQIKWGKLIPVSEITELIAEVERLRGACQQARKVISEIADTDSESRAGWAHKALAEALDQ